MRRVPLDFARSLIPTSHEFIVTLRTIYIRFSILYYSAELSRAVTYFILRESILYAERVLNRPAHGLTSGRRPPPPSISLYADSLQRTRRHKSRDTRQSLFHSARDDMSRYVASLRVSSNERCALFARTRMLRRDLISRGKSRIWILLGQNVPSPRSLFANGNPFDGFPSSPRHGDAFLARVRPLPWTLDSLVQQNSWLFATSVRLGNTFLYRAHLYLSSYQFVESAPTPFPNFRPEFRRWEWLVRGRNLAPRSNNKVLIN